MTDSLRVPKGIWINGALVAVVAAGGGLTYAMLGSSSTAKTTTGRTIAVQRGTVVSDVSASGNVALPGEVGLNFGAAGQVTEVDVHAGDQVKAGQVLAKVDPTAADQQLASAQAALVSAQAALAKLQQGQTSQQQALAAQQLKSAGDSLSAAKTSYADAKASIDADAANLQAAVTTANTTLATDQATELADCATPAKPTCSADTTKVTQDQNAVTQAVNAQKAGALKDTQSMHQAQNSLTQAQNSYTSTVDQQAVNAAPPTADQIAAANQQVTTAQNNVTAAQKAVADCVLTAPMDSTVISVAGNVGTPVTAGSTGSSGSSTSSGSSSSAAKSSSTPTAAGAAYQYSLSQVGTANYLTADLPRNSGTPATPIAQAVVSGGAGGAGVSGSATGFIVLGDMSSLTVKAEFAETDAAKLKPGENASVSLNALPGSAFTATVLSVDPTSTVVSNVVEYGVVLQFTPGQPGTDAVKPGQTAAVQVTTGSVDNVLFVPSSSVVTAGGQSTVTVVKDGVSTPTPVQVGMVGDSTTEIQSGLADGDLVLLSPRSGTSSTGSRTGGFGGGGFGGGTGGVRGGTGG